MENSHTGIAPHTRSPRTLTGELFLPSLFPSIAWQLAGDESAQQRRRVLGLMGQLLAYENSWLPEFHRSHGWFRNRRLR